MREGIYAAFIAVLVFIAVDAVGQEQRTYTDGVRDTLKAVFIACVDDNGFILVDKDGKEVEFICLEKRGGTAL